eukprot:1453380-Amphidinium_carterae.1
MSECIPERKENAAEAIQPLLGNSLVGRAAGIVITKVTISNRVTFACGRSRSALGQLSTFADYYQS